MKKITQIIKNKAIERGSEEILENAYEEEEIWFSQEDDISCFVLTVYMFMQIFLVFSLTTKNLLLRLFINIPLADNILEWFIVGNLFLTVYVGIKLYRIGKKWNIFH